MATTATKSIAVRLPYDEFIRRLRAATEANLSMSEYLHITLSDGDRVVEVEAELVSLRQQVSQLQREAREQADLAFEQECQADQQRIELLREMTQLQQQADTNQQHLQLALKEERVKREKMTKTAGAWQTQATDLQQAKTLLEQAIRTHQQTLARQQEELTQLEATNGSLVIENKKLQQESATIRAELAALRQQALTMLKKLTALHDESTFNYIPGQFWPILNEFEESLEAKS